MNLTYFSLCQEFFIRFIIRLNDLLDLNKLEYYITVCFFLFVFPPVWQLVLYIFSTFSPFSPPSLPYPLSLPSLTARVTFRPYRQSYPHENVTAAILSYAVSHLHEGTGKLRKTFVATVGHLTESVSSLTVMTSRSAFGCAGRGPAVTHPSTDPAKSCLTWVIAWHRTPTTHRTLSVITVCFNVIYFLFARTKFCM